MIVLDGQHVPVAAVFVPMAVRRVAVRRCCTFLPLLLRVGLAVPRSRRPVRAQAVLSQFMHRIEPYLLEVNSRLQNLATRQSVGNPGSVPTLAVRSQRIRSAR